MSEVMNSAKLIAAAINTFEQAPLPDALTRLAIRGLVARTSRALAGTGPQAAVDFARAMPSFPIAIHTDAANQQHYEVLSDFFGLVLGPQRKYSCCFYEGEQATLADAEEAALAETARRAGLADGQAILEMGCGWGSLSLWMARHFPNASITAVSNSHSQRAYIEGKARECGLTNLTIVTSDANVFAPGCTFDRIVSIEMFEHMSNWVELLTRATSWLRADGRMFVHIFTHPTAPYRFNHEDPSDWIGKYFFTGGIMPSEALMGQFPALFTVERQWRWSGAHYERTANDWLANFDRHSSEILRLFEKFYGPKDAKTWHRRWRLFFLATAGLFGYAGGSEWGVSHYLLRPAR